MFDVWEVYSTCLCEASPWCWQAVCGQQKSFTINSNMANDVPGCFDVDSVTVVISEFPRQDWKVLFHLE